MKKTILMMMAALVLTAVACKNKESKPDAHQHGAAAAPKTPQDSLEAAVLEGHDVGMAKYGKLKKMQGEMALMMDSLGRLPGKAREAAAALRTKAEEVSKDLVNAINGMDKWMGEFNLDSARDNVEQRIKYLTSEKLKVDQVKEAILGSLAKADSLLKAKMQ